MQVQLIRHATHILNYNGKKILVDPMFSEKGTLTPIENVPNTNYNPLVPLPIEIETLINCDLILLTHTHRDHFDDAAIQHIPKHIPILCQTEDILKLKSLGFQDIHGIKNSKIHDGIEFIRAKAKHGHGAIGIAMSPSSGYILKAENEPVVYITGDTIYFSEISRIISNHQPNVILGYCGEAKFCKGKAITLNTNDILKICALMSDAIFGAIHMEAWNHCRLSRESLNESIQKKGFQNQVWIPNDGESRLFETT